IGPPRMRSPEYCMQAFLWWRPETADRDLGLIKEAGFEWVKQGFGWRDIEGAGKGIFDWSRTDRIVAQVEQYGLKLVVRLDHQPYWAGGGFPANGPPANYEDFGDFCYALASRYRGRIPAYEIWNEPNLAREWGGRVPNAAEYVALLKVAYRRIKEADPNAMVISAGLTPTGTGPPTAIPDDAYLEQMYQAGAKDYFDVLGVHAAGYKAPPELSPDEAAANEFYGGQRFFCFRRVEDLRAIMVKYGDADKQVAVLEFGWTTDPIHPEYAWHAVTEEQQADYLVRAYQYAKEHWSPWIGMMCLIYIADPDWTEENEQYWWAITYPDYPETRVRPAYERLKAMPK
ncbi:MAG TPA: glycosyl hydrolase family protein, partial [Anaerolineae bacterium]|nr:glycosyl hydrolase family protein [Anaerolineae bacterium]